MINVMRLLKGPVLSVEPYLWKHTACEAEIAKLRGNVLWYEQQQKGLTGRVNVLNAEKLILLSRVRSQNFSLLFSGLIILAQFVLYVVVKHF